MTETIETRRAANRALMPATAAIFDHATEIFGPGCKLLYAAENGRVQGNPAYAHRRNGIDAIPGMPATHKHEAFMAVLNEEFVRRFHRLPTSTDAAWVQYVTDGMAARFDAFKP